jgi:peptide-methionine (S)-S-oxide reductase
VIRTRVGYAGGTPKDPTYHNLGDHSETIQIDYDPAQISYEDLLEVFWDSHYPAARPWSQQYASIIFYHDEEQERQATASWEREAAKYESQIFTEIVPLSDFYLAEDYHQKYRLRSVPLLLDEFSAIYPDEADLVDSTAATRVNGYVGGNGTYESLQAEIDKLGLSTEAREFLLERVRSSQP